MNILGGMFPGAGALESDTGFQAPVPIIHDTRPLDQIRDVHGMFPAISAGDTLPPRPTETVVSRLDPFYMPFMDQFRAVQQHVEAGRRTRYMANLAAQ